jgi:hypothetical protein
MPVTDTDNTITVAANVIHYYFLHKKRHSLPQGLKVRRIQEFTTSIIDKHPIAINKFIRADYERVQSFAHIKNWLAKRLQKQLAIHVNCLPLDRKVTVCLRDDYGFDCRSTDARYLQTCLNTIFKHLVTENTTHFDRPHRRPKQRSMSNYLRREISITICTIDKCCTVFLGI